MGTPRMNGAQQSWITTASGELRSVISVAKLCPVTVLGALLHDLPHQRRRVLRLQGPDTGRFLQGTVSADVTGAKPGDAVAATLLTVKAKIVSELIVLVHGEETIDLLIPADTFEAVETHLERHIIMDQVEVARRDDQVVAALWGEGLAEVAPPVRWACSHPVRGQLLVGTEAEIADALGAVARADAAAFDAHRIEAGVPAWGFEVRADFFPPEVGFVGAVSYDKGCYLGQEPLARIHARGQVNRVMVRVQVDGTGSVPLALDHADRPDSGTLTTVSGAVGLAIVRRSFATPGQSLTGEGVVVHVTSGPLGDDPGLRG